VVSEKSGANAAVPTVEGPGRTQTGFRGAGGEDAGQKNGLGSTDGRSAGPKMKISGKIRPLSTLRDTWRVQNAKSQIRRLRGL